MYATTTVREPIDCESIHVEDNQVHFHLSTHIYFSMSIHEARLVNVALSEILLKAHLDNEDDGA